MEQKHLPILLRFSKNYMEISIANVSNQIQFHEAALERSKHAFTTLQLLNIFPFPMGK